jgi:hypothetical protein
VTARTGRSQVTSRKHLETKRLLGNEYMDYRGHRYADYNRQCFLYGSHEVMEGEGFARENSTESIPCAGGVEYLQRSPRVVGGDEMGSLESEKENAVTSSTGIGPENDCAGEGRRKL